MYIAADSYSSEVLRPHIRDICSALCRREGASGWLGLLPLLLSVLGGPLAGELMPILGLLAKSYRGPPSASPPTWPLHSVQRIHTISLFQLQVQAHCSSSKALFDTW